MLFVVRRLVFDVRCASFVVCCVLLVGCLIFVFLSKMLLSLVCCLMFDVELCFLACCLFGCCLSRCCFCLFSVDCCCVFGVCCLLLVV